MDPQHEHKKNIDQKTLLSVAGMVILALFALVYFSLSTRLSRIDEQLASLTSQANQLEAGVATLNEKSQGLSDVLSATAVGLQNTQANIQNVQSQVGSVTETLGQVTGSVTTLEKLSKTDPELLQKYSKVFFLNEHYTPERVVGIPSEFLYYEKNPEVIHAHVAPYLGTLLSVAKSAGINLYILSAYRSFDEQQNLKSDYTVVYGAGTANQFSADQGYSEHQLGTAVDFMTTGIGGTLDGFDTTGAYAWLTSHAHLYGFTLSYPKGNSFYIFEPWHWRYVGVALATELYNSDKHFYDLDQREIDAYLVRLFE